MIEFFAAAGGLFAMLSFVHFFGDWLFQSQYEATNKSKNWKVRAWHCTVYTLFFIFPIAFLDPLNTIFLACLAILWVSHFVIDTYIPVVLWAYHLRRIPQMREIAHKEDATKVFVELWSKPIYPILFITVDQILHLTFLWPVVFLILL